MNLREMRKSKIEEKFIYMLTKYNLQTICPDQDYLNVLCRDRVIYLNESWDKMSQFGTAMDEDEISIIHYNMFRKPWHYKDANYSSLFWKWAKKTEFFDASVVSDSVQPHGLQPTRLLHPWDFPGKSTLCCCCCCCCCC